MGIHRTRQTNHIEYCPVCYLRLSNRASAVSHYRMHVRQTELEERYGPEFQLPDLFFGKAVWWRKGMSAEDIANFMRPTERLPLQDARKRFVTREYRKQYK